MIWDHGSVTFVQHLKLSKVHSQLWGPMKHNRRWPEQNWNPEALLNYGILQKFSFSVWLYAPSTSSFLDEKGSVMKYPFFPCLFWFVWGRIWVVPGRELWCTLAFKWNITAGWKQGDIDTFISLVTQNIQPRRPRSVMGLKESEFHNWFFKMWQ